MIQLAGVKHLLAVASGKGGVGKSTTAVNVALGLSRLKQRVGLLDADIYGPSIPRMLNLKGKPSISPQKLLMPMQNYGIKCMSMGFLVEEDSPMIWRGPMVMGALEQLLGKVEWGHLDVLVIDLPPGTGDAHLSLTQRVALSGAVIVSTPQDIALIDARRGANMFRKVNVPVLGMIQNMSHFVCPECSSVSYVFGHDGARNTAKEFGIDFLGDIPLHTSICTTSDSGKPITVSDPDSAQAKAYFSIAERLLTKLNEQTQATPKIILS